MNKYTLFLVMLILADISAFAQRSPSPFDLLPRLEGVSHNDSTQATAIASNPFNIIKNGPHKRPSQAAGFSVEKEKKPLSAEEKESVYKRFLFIVVLLMMVVLTLVVTIFKLLLARIWRGFLNDNILGQLIREYGSGLAWAYRILYAMFFLNAGLFLFLSLRHFGITVASSNLSSYLLCTAGIAGYFIIKHIVLAFIGTVYPVEKEVAVYGFTIQIFNIVSGFALVPAVIFIAYATSDIAQLTIYLAGAVLSLVFSFLILRGIFIANRFLAWNKFHFFLYLCAVEIAPILFLIKQL